MQEKSHSTLNLLIALGIFVAVGVAGYMYETRDQSSDATLTSAPAGGETNTVDKDLLDALGQLRALSLDESVFKNPVFTSLNDFSTDLIPQDAGRPNPFAPFATSTFQSSFTSPSSIGVTSPNNPTSTSTTGQ